MAYGTKTTWIVVADHRRARILRYVGPNEGLHLIENGEMAADQPPPPEDRPGRVHESATSARHAVQSGQDPHVEVEYAFLSKVADRVNRAAVTNGFDRLVLVAAPAALGELRQRLSDNARGLVTASLDKDLTQERLDRLPERLGDIMNI